MDPAQIDPKYLVEAAHTVEATEVLDRLGSTPDGLSAAEAAARHAEVGPNELPEGQVRTLPTMIIDSSRTS